ncbi:MAG TPA: hypothetical protein PKG48_13940, partial [Bacteroidales bacterium]|nr:hypothetical protein [Bacteroidales bacterium]
MNLSKRLLGAVIGCLISLTAVSETVVNIGTGSSSQLYPFNFWGGYARSAAIYTASEIGSSGLITSLGWQRETGDIEICPVKIYLKQTATSTLSAATWSTMISGATLVYNSTATFPASDWQTIDIADFVYNNSNGDNLLVLCEANFGGNGASSSPNFAYSYNPSKHETWQQYDSPPTGSGVPDENRPNLQVSFLPLTTPYPPSGFIAQANGTSQVDLTWKKNAAGNSVMVAFNTSSTFGTPSGSYSAGNTISGGGTVIYNGSGTSYSHTGLNPATTYYYRAWSVLPPSPTYSTGTNTAATTACTTLASFPDLTNFETSAFPPTCWSLAQKPWTHSGSASANGSGSGSAMADFFDVTGGYSFDLISPVLNLAGLTSPVVSFDHAYATYSGQEDYLELWISTNSGGSYTLATTWLGGSTGPLNTGGEVTSSFIPTSGQWASKSYTLSTSVNRILFRGVSAWGNNLYLDNISIHGTCTPGSSPTAVITPSGSTTFCPGGSVTLTASGGTGYVWSNAATTAAINVTTGGTYTVTVTNAAGCTATASRSVTVNAQPTAVITPSGSTTFCQGGSVTLTASGGTGYVWSNAATTTAITVSTTGTYTVTVTNTAGCTATASRSVTVNALPTAVITPGGSTTFCQGGSVVLTASGGTGYVWSNAATTAAITVTTGGSYTVTVTNSAGCTATANRSVTVNTLPTAVITADGPTTFCLGGSVTLT